MEQKLRIVLMAPDEAKVKLSWVCTAYKSILKNCSLYATEPTGVYIQTITGLKVEQMLPAGEAGFQQVMHLISRHELDAIFFFRGALDESLQRTETQLLKLCDEEEVPYATNLATAEALVFSIRHEVINPYLKKREKG